MAEGFFGSTVAIVVVVISLLSGALSVFREVQIMYFPPAQPDKRKVFWVFVRIAFIISAVFLFCNERTKVRELERAINDAPNVGIAFDNTRDYVLSPNSREEHNWFVRIKVTADKKLTGARVAFTNISKVGSDVMRQDSSAYVGAWGDAPIFGPKVIYANQPKYFGLFFSPPRRNDELHLFVVSTKGMTSWAMKDNYPAPPEYQLLQPLPIGEYVIEVTVTADNLAKPFTKAFRVKWKGSMADFRMEPVV